MAAREKRNRFLTAGIVTAMAVLVGCVDPYTPSIKNQATGYLVIDGVLDTGGDTIRFTLSRTVSVTGTDSAVAEASASVAIEEENGNSYQLTNTQDGNYFLPPGVLDASKNLRLNVLGIDRKTYVSDYLPAVVNPPISSIAVDTAVTINGEGGVEFYVNTSDPLNQAKYFLWRFDETWAYNTPYESSLIQAPGGLLLTRTADQLINRCYRTQGSTEVLVSSTIGLSTNEINNFPLTHIVYSSPKVSIKYSMLVHQFAITQEAYEFWTSIKKNTEGLGTIFGPLPVQVSGNYRCVTDPSTPVLGFLSVTNQQSQRLTIDDSRVPYAPVNDPFYADCDEVLLDPQSAAASTTLLFLYPQYSGLNLEGYYATTPKCADCRLHGGTTTKPPFF